MNFKHTNSTNLDIDINYLGTKINEVNNTKFLGLIMDSKLNWNLHTDNICKRLKQFSYALFKLRKVTNESALQTAYHGHVSSVLRYGTIFWGNSSGKLKVFRAQKRCIRAMCGLKRLDSCKEHFIRLKLLTFPAIYVYEVAMFVKCNPNLFEEFATGSRLEGKLRNVPCKTQLFRMSVFCMAPTIYNKIPMSVRMLSINEFKIKLKDILSNRAYYTINEFLSDQMKT